TNSDEDVLSPTTSWLGTNRHLQAAIAAIDDRLLFYAFVRNWKERNSQLECVFINPPLVQDFNRTEEEVEADRQKPHTWVLPVGNQRPRDMPSMVWLLRTALKIKFEAAYNSYYKNYCNFFVIKKQKKKKTQTQVRAFTYHKLVLSYGGEHSDLLFILSWLVLIY
ncbi:hypothetical protein Mgra_00004556, partial [Meloidogyne graminicola]